MLINVAIVRLLSLLYRIPLPDSTAIYSSLLLIDTYFSCFAFMNNAALSFILHIFIAPVQEVSWVVFWQIHSLTFPYSALYLRDPTHTGCISQTPVHLACFWTEPVGGTGGRRRKEVIVLISISLR